MLLIFSTHSLSMAWPELLKARDNLKNIERQIDLLMKNHNSLTKRELARQNEFLLANFDESLKMIKAELKEFDLNMRNHRNHIESKSRFMKRHYRRI